MGTPVSASDPSTEQAEPRRQAAAAERARRAQEILACLRALAPQALAGYPVDAAYVYGSVARGTPLPDSDVDIALLWKSAPLAGYQRLLLETDVQAALEDASRLNHLDVHSLNDAPLNVQGTILTEGVLIYCADHDHRVAFEVAVRKRYFDFQPVAARLHENIMRRMRQGGLRYGQNRNR
jgi:predicted nucleotidyltransferase